MTFDHQPVPRGHRLRTELQLTCLIVSMTIVFVVVVGWAALRLLHGAP
jgi:hypothetical protein